MDLTVCIVFGDANNNNQAHISEYGTDVGSWKKRRILTVPTIGASQTLYLHFLFLTR